MSQPYLFINYRKKDTVILADSLSLLLRDAFGEVVFLDSSELEKGAEFPPLIEEALNKATCMLVLLGERWLHQYDQPTGKRRLDLPDDWVRLEIERALTRGIDVIPVLAPEAHMPPEEAFPESIRSLPSRVPILLRTQSYVVDRQALIEELATNHGFKRRQVATAAPSRRRAAFEHVRERVPRPAAADGIHTGGPKAWVNGTVLHYYFYRDPSAAQGAAPAGKPEWGGKSDDISAVRDAIQQWKDIGIGLDFEEVDTPETAEVRIGFAAGEGSWSYIGRDAADSVPAGQRTMNFGWSVAMPGGTDTALHEFGHVLGLAEEHQNPNSGIVWDEAAVYELMQGPPNHWSREQTQHSILRKGDPNWYYGPWDPNSIMHFTFNAGLILEPEMYRSGLVPEPGLSPGDKNKIRFLYPPLTSLQPTLVPFETAPLLIQSGEQANFTVLPTEHRSYNFQTFGSAEVVIMLFEENEGELDTVAADDNTGQNRPAMLTSNLDAGRRYVLRVRLFEREGEMALMMW